jgi:hypothetical protein
MPISRQKSCEQCRLAKTRCSLDTICSRCVDRGLSCKYAGGPSYRMSPYSRHRLFELEQNSNPSLNPAITTPTPQSGSFRLPDSEVPHSDFGNIRGKAPVLDNIDRHDLASDQINASQSVSWQQASWGRSEETTHPHMTGECSNVEVTNSPSWDMLSTSMFPWYFLATSSLGHNQAMTGSTATVAATSEQADEDVSRTVRLPQPNFASSQGEASEQSTEVPDGSIVAVYGRRFKHFLALRRAPTPEKSLMTRVLFGQIANYPRMLVQGSRLPPFIYPPCALNNRLPHQCTALNGSHQCLPEPLANCAVLTQMFFSRNTGNAQLVWKTIYNEQKRLYEQVSNPFLSDFWLLPFTSLPGMSGKLQDGAIILDLAQVERSIVLTCI